MKHSHTHTHINHALFTIFFTSYSVNDFAKVCVNSDRIVKKLKGINRNGNKELQSVHLHGDYRNGSRTTNRYSCDTKHGKSRRVLTFFFFVAKDNSSGCSDSFSH